MSKACSKCGETKPLVEFNKDTKMADGCRSNCKACVKLYDRKRYRENAEDNRASAQKNRDDNPEEHKARSKLRYAANPEPKKASIKKYRAANRHKTLAQNLVNRALKSGTLTRPSNCERCTNPAEEAHHPDYSRPLDVIWLCVPCHGLEHRIGT